MEYYRPPSAGFMCAGTHSRGNAAW